SQGGVLVPFGEMCQVARMKNERRWLWRSLDLRHRGAESRRDVGVRGFVESDVAVADLDKAECTVPVRHHRAARLAQRRSFQDAARQRPGCASPYPCHAFQKMSSIEIVLVIC